MLYLVPCVASQLKPGRATSEAREVLGLAEPCSASGPSALLGQLERTIDLMCHESALTSDVASWH